MADMEVGRELDALVAEKVMDEPVNRSERGWHTIGPRRLLIGPARCRYSDQIWSPSLRIADAWEVVERLRSSELAFTWGARRDVAITQMDRLEGGQWVVETDGNPTETRPNGTRVLGLADTAPHAICLAALKAVSAIE